MSYKDLLVVLDTDASARVRIEIAAALAERFAAHLAGLHPLPMPEAPRHFGYFDPALLNPFFEELRARARDTADKTRQAFERHCHGNSIEHAVRAEIRRASCRCDGTSPLYSSFCSEYPQCGSGYEVALQVEGVVNSSVHLRKRWADRGDLKRCSLRSRRRTG